MLQFLVKVKKRLWDKENQPTFLEEGDIAADCLRDLSVSDNKLSVWEISANESNLERILTALAANCDHPTNIDYLVFDAEIPVRLGLAVHGNPGRTPDRAADEAWHRDLVEISGKKLLALATEIFQTVSPKRCPEKRILAMLKAAISADQIDLARVRDTLLAKIVDDKPSPST